MASGFGAADGAVAVRPGAESEVRRSFRLVRSDSARWRSGRATSMALLCVSAIATPVCHVLLRNSASWRISRFSALPRSAYHADISPRRRAHRLGPERASRLRGAIRQVLALGIENRGTTFCDYVDADGQLGSNQEMLAAYGREGAPCRRCKSPIKRLVQASRQR